MSEENKTSTAPTPPPSKPTIVLGKPGPSGYSAPLSPIGIVKGGTLSSSYEKHLRETEQEAEARRDAQDAERAATQVPIEQGGAKMFSHNFAHATDSPKTLIHYCSSADDKYGLPMLCDILVENDGSSLKLVFVCPKCILRGVPQGQAQLHIDTKHRFWALDETPTKTPGDKLKGDMLNFGGDIYVSAGRVMDTEVLRCPNVGCPLCVKIHKGVMYDV